MKNKILVLVISISCTFLSFAQNDAEKKGLEIALAADKADLGFGSSTVQLIMVLKNKNGQTSERKMNTKTLEMKTDGDKSLIIFNTPKDVKGTATLTFTHREGSDDQWLYLPSIKRVKRISSNNKSGPFMGSEFSYEDLSSQEVEKYTYTFVKNQGSMVIVDQDPKDPKSGYKHRAVSYNKDKDYRIEKIEFYDRKNALLKTLTYSNYKKYKGKYWRAGTLNMINHQSNKETSLKFDEYNFDVQLTEDDFTQNALKRAGK